MRHPPHTTRRAFTLIEIIVVIGVIGTLIGIGFTALRDTSPTTGLRIGQGQLVSLFTALRAQAALSGQNARLILDANDNDPVYYLRRLRIVTQDPEDSNNWILLNEGVVLPEGVFVVPPGSGAPRLAEGGTWTAGTPRSTLDGPEELRVNGSLQVLRSGTPPILATFYFVEVTPRGTLTNSAHTRLVLGAGRRIDEVGTNDVGFLSSDLVRGIRWSQYGLARVVNDRQGFL